MRVSVGRHEDSVSIPPEGIKKAPPRPGGAIFYGFVYMTYFYVYHSVSSTALILYRALPPSCNIILSGM